MPKIIENLENRLMEEARRQVEASGYGNVTIRSVASACGIGVGTVYHYYPSKDALIAAFMLQDWNECMDTILCVSETSARPEDAIRCIYDQLRSYSQRYQAIFQDQSAASAFSGAFSTYHHMLRDQLAAPLRKFCDDPFTAEFIAEALLTWTVAGTDFETMAGILTKLFNC